MAWRNRQSPAQISAGLRVPVPAITCGKTSAQSIPASATTVVAFNTDKFPGAATGGLALSNGTVTAPVTGWYHVSASVTFASSVSGARRILWVSKGTTPGSLTAHIGTNATSSAQSPAAISTLSASADIWCEAGEVLGAAVHVAAAWGLDVSQAYMHNLSVHYVGSA